MTGIILHQNNELEEMRAALNVAAAERAATVGTLQQWGDFAMARLGQLHLRAPVHLAHLCSFGWLRDEILECNGAVLSLYVGI